MMRVLALALVTFLPAVAFASPTIDRPVVDEVGILDEGFRTRLEARLRAHASHRATIALLVVGTTGTEPIEDYANRVATEWGGSHDARDVLVIVAMDDHRSRIEVGRGLEATLSDGRVAEMLRAVRYLFRDGDPKSAIWHLLDDLVVATGGSTAPIPEAPESPFGARVEAEHADARYFGGLVNAPALVERIQSMDFEISCAVFGAWMLFILAYPLLRDRANGLIDPEARQRSTTSVVIASRVALGAVIAWNLVASACGQFVGLRVFVGAIVFFVVALFGYVLSGSVAFIRGLRSAHLFVFFVDEFVPDVARNFSRRRGSGRSFRVDGWSGSSDSSYSSHSSETSHSSDSSSYGDGGGSFDGGGSSDSW